jgi:hypothetical protein
MLRGFIKLFLDRRPKLSLHNYFFPKPKSKLFSAVSLHLKFPIRVCFICLRQPSTQVHMSFLLYVIILYPVLVSISTVSVSQRFAKVSLVSYSQPQCSKWVVIAPNRPPHLASHSYFRAQRQCHESQVFPWPRTSMQPPPVQPYQSPLLHAYLSFQLPYRSLLPGNRSLGT